MAGKEGAQPLKHTDGVKQALADVRGLGLPVPPCLTTMECELQTSQYIKESKWELFHGSLACMQSDETFIAERTLAALSFVLRPNTEETSGEAGKRATDASTASWTPISATPRPNKC